jgi:hypothetical protein
MRERGQNMGENSKKKKESYPRSSSGPFRVVRFGGPHIV